MLLLKSSKKKCMLLVIILCVILSNGTVSVAKTRANAARLPGVISSNESVSVYWDCAWETPTHSYLVNTDNGGLMRVEYMNGIWGRYIYIEEYSATNQLIFSKKMKTELSYFAGFYADGTNYYIVYGQYNKKESNDVEVFRIVKYSKDWKRLGDCRIKAVDTTIPTDAGTLRMTSTDTTLFVHTCHTMYVSEDGFNHQSNITFAMDKGSMQLIESETGQKYLETGYVSHSFNQFVLTDGTYLYRVDHGDAYSRGVEISCVYADNPNEHVDTCVPLMFEGEEGDNTTGASLGGAELSDKNILVAGNYANTSLWEDGPRNIFIITVSRQDMDDTNIRYLTNYGEDTIYDISPPKLVKVSGNAFLVMWKVRHTETDKQTTKMVLLDGAGNQLGDIVTTDVKLSDCQPIVLPDGTVSWYVTPTESVMDNWCSETDMYYGDAPILYNIDPYNLSGLGKTVKIPKTTIIKTRDGMTYKLGKKYTATLIGVDKNIKKCTIPTRIGKGYKWYNVTSIGKKALANRTSLKKITIGSNVKSIGSNAFKGCSKLKTITIKSKKLSSKEVSKTAFKGVYKKTTVKVPSSKKSAYKKWLYKKGLPKKAKIK